MYLLSRLQMVPEGELSGAIKHLIVQMEDDFQRIMQSYLEALVGCGGGDGTLGLSMQIGTPALAASSAVSLSDDYRKICTLRKRRTLFRTEAHHVGNGP